MASFYKTQLLGKPVFLIVVLKNLNDHIDKELFQKEIVFHCHIVEGRE